MEKLHFSLKTCIAIVAAILLLTACNKKDTPIPDRSQQLLPIKAGFVQDVIHVTESGTETTTQIQLSASSNKEEKLVLKLNPQTAQYGIDFTTNPVAVDGFIEIPIARGSREAALQIIPINNQIKNGERLVVVEIDAQKSSVALDNRHSVRLQLLDDETVAVIGFAQNDSKVNEASNHHKEVVLNINPLAISDGYVDIAFNTTLGGYGTHFTTTPELNNGKIRVPIRMGETSVRFYVKPVNDQQIQPDRKIRFSVVHTQGSFEVGISNLHTLTIEEDDKQAIANTKIASLRNNYSGTPMYLFAPITIGGVITSVKDNIESSVAYVEDETGGIAIHFNQSHNLRAGELVTIQLQQGSELRERNGALEMSGVSTTDAQVIGWDIKLVKSYTLSELYQGPNKEGQLVTITDVRFPEANGQLSFYGDRTISDGSKTAIVRTHAFASFRNQIIPTHKVYVTGILIYDQGNYIIMPLNSSSIR